MTSSAIISPDGLYRYELRREWDISGRPLVVGMLNPSTADETFNDPTIERCIRRAKLNGYGSLIVWNLGAGRATDPKDWLRMDDPIGPENDAFIRNILTKCRARNGTALVGWGALRHKLIDQRVRTVRQIAASVGVQFWCLGYTKDREPRHPLYVSYSQQIVVWPILRGPA